MRPFVTGILFVITGIMVASNIYTLIPLYPSIGNEFQIPGTEVAMESILFTFFYAFGLLFFGPLSDYAGRRKVILTGLFMSAVTTWLVSTANQPVSLYIFRALQGFTLASFAPVTFSYTFEIFGDKKRTFWLALINAGFLAAGMVDS